jgi:hypothetical protein
MKKARSTFFTFPAITHKQALGAVEHWTDKACTSFFDGKHSNECTCFPPPPPVHYRHSVPLRDMYHAEVGPTWRGHRRAGTKTREGDLKKGVYDTSRTLGDTAGAARVPSICHERCHRGLNDGCGSRKLECNHCGITWPTSLVPSWRFYLVLLFCGKPVIEHQAYACSYVRIEGFMMVGA